MTKLQKFTKFVEALSGQQREDVERLMESVMLNYDERYKLSAEQEAEIERRIADPNPKYVSDVEMEEFFGKPLNS